MSVGKLTVFTDILKFLGKGLSGRTTKKLFFAASPTILNTLRFHQQIVYLICR